MANEFVRKIRNTNLDESKGNVEPFETNEDCDLLSDGKNIYVRVGNKYVNITEKVELMSKNSMLVINEHNGVLELTANKSTKPQVESGTVTDTIVNPVMLKHGIDHHVPKVIDSKMEDIVNSVINKLREDGVIT